MYLQLQTTCIVKISTQNYVNYLILGQTHFVLILLHLSFNDSPENTPECTTELLDLNMFPDILTARGAAHTSIQNSQFDTKIHNCLVKGPILKWPESALSYIRIYEY